MSTKAACHCGWTGGPYANPALAEAAARRHRCDRYRRECERATRVAARQADEGVRVNCRHSTRHEHGTRAAYVLDGCTCRPCRDANRTYENDRTRQQMYGRWQPYVDAGPVRDHVRALSEAGMGWKRVAAAAGVSGGAMSKLLWGVAGRTPSARVRRETADRILAVCPDTAGGALVPAFPAVRRLQALVAAGWPQAQLAARLGMLPSNFGSLLHRSAARASTVDAVRTLYRELAFTDPETAGVPTASVTRARRYAQDRPWLGPDLWDDDQLDDPDGQPWTSTGPEKRSSNELVEDVDWMARAGESTAGAARRLELQPASLERALERAGRTDLWRALRLNAERATA